MKGMQKIKRGRGFRGALDYALDREKGKDPGEIIGGNMSGTDAPTLSREFRATREQRPDIDKPVWHQSLRLPKGEHLTAEKWQAVADDYMQRMGFTEDHQRVYVMHDDPEGQHLHIIASRISLDGSLYYGQNENLASTKHIAELERVHGLTISPGPGPDSGQQRRLSKGEIEMAIRKGDAPPKLILQSAIDEALHGNPDTSVFLERLESAGIVVRPNVARTGRVSGISFEIEGIAFKGSSLGKAYSWSQLQKRGLNYEQARDSQEIERAANQSNIAADPGAAQTTERERRRTGEEDRAAGAKHGKSGRGIERADQGDARSFRESGRRAQRNDRGRQNDTAAHQNENLENDSNLGVYQPCDYESAADRISFLAAGKSVSGRKRRGVDTSKRRREMKYDRTKVAVQRQLKGMGCELYEIGLSSDHGMMTRTWTAAEIIKNLGWLKRQNGSGEDIYIRPAKDRDSNLVLVDDLSVSEIKNMKEVGHEPAVVTQTSPGNFQAWLKFDQDLPARIRTKIAKMLCAEHNADPNSADYGHFGRLAGFTNRKPEHVNESGKSPFVLLDTYNGKHCTNAEQIREDAKQSLGAERQSAIDSAVEKGLQNIPSADPSKPVLSRAELGRWYVDFCNDLARDFGIDYDPSRADWRVALSMYSKGHSEDDVESIMRQFSPGITERKAGHIEDYVERTVRRSHSYFHAKQRGISYEEWAAGYKVIQNNKVQQKNSIDEQEGLRF